MKDQGGSLGELGEPSQRRPAEIRMSERSGGWVGRSDLAGRIEWEKDGGLREPRVACGQPGGSEAEEFTCNAGDPGSIPGLVSSPGEENGKYG